MLCRLKLKITIVLFLFVCVVFAHECAFVYMKPRPPPPAQRTAAPPRVLILFCLRIVVAHFRLVAAAARAAQHSKIVAFDFTGVIIRVLFSFLFVATSCAASTAAGYRYVLLSIDFVLF